MLSNPRSQRVADRIQAELADILQKRLKDPRLGFLTLTSVEVTRDLKQAKVHVSVLDDQELEPTLEVLVRARGFLRSQLGHRLHLRHIPELSFIPDHSVEHGLRVAKLLGELRDRGELGDEEAE